MATQSISRLSKALNAIEQKIQTGCMSEAHILACTIFEILPDHFWVARLYANTVKDKTTKAHLKMKILENFREIPTAHSDLIEFMCDYELFDGEVLELLEAALQLFPDDFWVLWQVSRAFKAIGEDEKSLHMIHKLVFQFSHDLKMKEKIESLKKNLFSPDAIINEIRQLIDSMKISQAEELTEKWLAEYPNNLWLRRLQNSFSNNACVRINSLRNMIVEFPENSTSFTDLILFMMSCDCDEFEREIDMLIEEAQLKFPNDVWVLDCAAQVAERRGRMHASLQLWLKLLLLAPDHHRAKENTARLKSKIDSSIR